MGLTLAQDKEFCYIYLLRKHFNNDSTALARTFTLTRAKIQEYEKRWGDAVSDTIRAEEEGRKLNGPKAPSIRSLKDSLLIRIEKVIDKEDNPANLANTYARLSEFQQTTEGQGSAESISDIVIQNIKKKKK